MLEVSTEDDHSKNSHECNAEYRLLTSADGGAAKPVDVITSDGDWGRSLSIHLSGFSQDGKRLFGVFNEGGKYALTVPTVRGCWFRAGVTPLTARSYSCLAGYFEMDEAIVDGWWVNLP